LRVAFLRAAAVDRLLAREPDQAITREEWEAMRQAKAERIRQAALAGDPVEDDMFDDDIG